MENKKETVRPSEENLNNPATITRLAFGIIGGALIVAGGLAYATFIEKVANYSAW